MKIRMVSDLHLEFDGPAQFFKLPELPDDKETVLILSGDIGLCAKISEIERFISYHAPKFRRVLYIPGNHEFYNNVYDNVIPALRNCVSEIPNAEFMEKRVLDIDGVRFIGATLWTDMDRENPGTIMSSQMGMNDYHCITKEYYIEGSADVVRRRFTPEDSIVDHKIAKNFIFSTLANTPSQMKTVVFTHHLPSERSVHKMFMGSRVNGAYFSDLEREVEEFKPTLYIHGHTHYSFDYMLFDTRVVCNPRGYYGYELNPDFDPALVIEV